MPAIISNGLHLITFCLFSLGVGHSSLHQMSLLYRRDGLCKVSPLDFISRCQKDWEGGGGIIPSHAQAWWCCPAVVHPDIRADTPVPSSVSRVRASRHIKEKYLLPIQSFGTDSIFTCTAISSNYIVLIHSQDVFLMLLRGPESLFKSLQIFQFHLPSMIFQNLFSISLESENLVWNLCKFEETTQLFTANAYIVFFFF